MRSCSPSDGRGADPAVATTQRAAGLLEVAAGHPSFPIILETTRECLQDVFDLPSLVERARELRARTLRMVTVDTPGRRRSRSRCCTPWIATFMYEGDAPLAERRAAALSLDRNLLRELLGTEELRELLDPEALAELELELQRLTPDLRNRVHGVDDGHDLVRSLGDLTETEIADRAALPIADFLPELRSSRHRDRHRGQR